MTKRLEFFDTDIKSEKNDITSGRHKIILPTLNETMPARHCVIFKSQHYFRNKVTQFLNTDIKSKRNDTMSARACVILSF
jgi:hypothetical protein